jgi:tetratricopeptide (TPR) repeat protein
VIHYPDEQRCPEAFFALSQAYEADGDYDEAIARSRDLLIYHPESPYAPAASARLPYLRMARVRRDDYDRGELLKAQGELAAWRTHYPNHELAGWVGELERECSTRLVHSDLYLAGFYRQTESVDGQRLHAERARALAQENGLGDEVAEAEAILASLPPAQSEPAPTPPGQP